MFRDSDSSSIDQAKHRMSRRLGETPHVIGLKFVEQDRRVMVIGACRGSTGMKWLTDNLQTEPRMPVYFADLLTREMIDKAENGMLDDFKKRLPDE